MVGVSDHIGFHAGHSDFYRCGFISHRHDHVISRDGLHLAVFLEAQIVLSDLTGCGAGVDMDIVEAEQIAEHVRVDTAEIRNLENIRHHLNHRYVLTLPGEGVSHLTAGKTASDNSDILSHGTVFKQIFLGITDMSLVSSGDRELALHGAGGYDHRIHFFTLYQGVIHSSVQMHGDLQVAQLFVIPGQKALILILEFRN